jgi:hypothetical protein
MRDAPQNGFGQSVVMAVPDASDRRLNSCLFQPLGVFVRDVLNAMVRMMDKSAALH